MEKQNRYISSLSNIDLNKAWDMFVAIVSRPVIEIFHGITSKSIDWFVCLVPGCLFNILVLTRLDGPLFGIMKLGWLLPPAGMWTYFIYCFAGAVSGFAIWGFWQTILHNQVSRKLTDVFQTSGLKNSIGKLPAFIFDKPIDEFTRKMRLSRANLPLSQFISAKENLESALQVYIDEIKEDRERGTVDIIYAGSAIPTGVKLTDITEIGKCRFLIGETRARKIIADLRETPHFLIGGQSGGGKSTFLRQIITTLYLNNPKFEFVLIDLKGGLEFQIFENMERMNVVPNTSGALEFMERLDETLQSRMAILKQNECKDIDAFLNLPAEKRTTSCAINRTVAVIDEAAELFMASDKSGANDAQRAKRLVIKLAAQGRAVGIHLIIATQRPDVKAVDGQIKANLSGIVAFQMPNMHSSQTILDNSRAAHLPKIPGRCIWKTSLEQTEVQTPFLTVEETSSLLKSKKENSDEA